MKPLTQEHTATLYVDGEELIRFFDNEETQKAFDEAVQECGGEVSLMEWKPRHKIWLRTKMSITGHKSQSENAA